MDNVYIFSEPNRSISSFDSLSWDNHWNNKNQEHVIEASAELYKPYTILPIM